MGFTHASLREISGLSLRTIERIEAGYAPSGSTVYCLMHPLAYGRTVANALLDGPIDPDALDALAAPVDALRRLDMIPTPYRDDSVFFRRVGRGLAPLVSAGSYVLCVAGPVTGPALALVEFRRRAMAVRFAARVGDVWQLSETPEGKGWHEVQAERVVRVSRVLSEVRKIVVG